MLSRCHTDCSFSIWSAASVDPTLQQAKPRNKYQQLVVRGSASLSLDGPAAVDFVAGAGDHLCILGGQEDDYLGNLRGRQAEQKADIDRLITGGTLRTRAFS